jgi:protein-L-isoaspartate(D-aspartate) O-methyltransferase
MQALQNELVEKLKREGHLQSSQVEAAFRAIPRHRFLPEAELAEVYTDQAIITKRESG